MNDHASTDDPTGHDTVDDGRYAQLDHEVIERLTIDSDPWLSCDDCFEQADGAVEGIIAENVPLTTEFGVHLSACPVCHEEAVSLAELIAEDFNLSPDEAVARLESAVARAAA